MLTKWQVFDMKESHITKLITSGETPSKKTIIAAALLLAWPAIVEQIMLTAVQFVDAAMVGRLGADATAAVGLTYAPNWVFSAIYASTAMGFSVQVAQHLGAERDEQAKRVVAQSLRIVAILGFALAIIGVLISFRLPIWLGAEDIIVKPAGMYFRIIAGGIPLTFGVMMISSMFRCAGDTKSPMMLNTMINIINVVLNFLFIYETRPMAVLGMELTMPGLGLGVVGAAIASVTSTGIVFCIFIWMLFHRESPIRISRDTDGRLEKDCLATAFRLGGPIAMERLAMSGAQIAQTAIITNIGTVALAAHHLAVTAESISYAPAFGVSQSATAMVGQAIGAKRKDLAMHFAKVSIVMAMIMMTLGGVILFVFAEPLIRILSSDPEVVIIGGKALRIVAFAEPLFGAAIVSSGVLRGAGDSRFPFLISMSTMWGVRITLSLIFSRRFGLPGVWMAMAVELAVRGGVFLIRVLRGKWVDSRLFKE